MSTLLNSIKNKNDQFIQEFIEKNNIKISTLGPAGTSSSVTAEYLVKELKKVNEKCKSEIVLQNNFDLVFHDLFEGKADYALVPTAYEKVTDYFWCEQFYNVLNFIYCTPKYGVVSKMDFKVHDANVIKMASCPAVENMIYYNDMGIRKEIQIEIVHAHSTAEAVKFVCTGKADLGITNETSLNEHIGEGVKFISKLYQAEILWALFGRRQIV